MSPVIEEDVALINAAITKQMEGLSGKTILIAGGAGFLPRYFLELIAYFNDHFHGDKCKVISVDNFLTGLPERSAHLENRKDFRFLVADIIEPLAIDGDIDYIIHGASVASPPFYRKYPLQTINVNVLGTRNLLELALHKKAKSLVYLSSSEVYGDPSPDAIPTPESYKGNVSCTGPRACYDESKRLAETLCVAYHQEFSLPVKIIRPFNVHGPGLSLQDGRVTPDFIRDALKNEPITILSDGKATRSFCYISDAVEAIFMILLSDADGEVFNVGSGEEITIETLARTINNLFDGKPGIRFAKSADQHYLTDNPLRRCPDLSKINQHFGWSPKIGLTEGLLRTIRWCKENRKGIE